MLTRSLSLLAFVRQMLPVPIKPTRRASMKPVIASAWRIQRSIVAALGILALASALSAASPHGAVRAWRQMHEKAILADFTTFLSLPNVATKISDIEKNAAYIESELNKRGFVTKTLSAGSGTPPSVFAELGIPGAKRTVLFYAHYDGQPISQKGWIIEPFNPSVRTALPEAKPADWKSAQGPLDPNWRIFARGSGDDKASIQALISAFDALKANGIKPSVNIKLLYEGEEEQGSPHFGKIVNQNRDLLKADALIMGDGPMHQSGRQMVGFGNRGIVGFTLTVYGPINPLHDGHYGSFAPSPSVMLARLIASLRDDNGKILIPGIYDDVVAPTAADEAAIAGMPPIEQQLKRSLGIGRNIGPARLAEGYLKPTLNVRSIHVGDEGRDAANAIATEGFASVDIRLVQGETPARVHKLVESYLTSLGWTIVRSAPDLETRIAHPKILKLDWDKGESIAAKTALDLPAARAVVASIGRTVGYHPIELPTSGGSSGIAEAVDQLHTPMIGVSIANYDDNQHARNENLRLGNLWDGIEVYAGLLADLDWPGT
jgi:acetylornithine deacetylase/succinyl-diaminopimelate desuccinylase-like protein